jgi:hypothetical protein
VPVRTVGSDPVKGAADPHQHGFPPPETLDRLSVMYVLKTCARALGGSQPWPAGRRSRASPPSFLGTVSFLPEHRRQESASIDSTLCRVTRSRPVREGTAGRHASPATSRSPAAALAASCRWRTVHVRMGSGDASWGSGRDRGSGWRRVLCPPPEPLDTGRSDPREPPDARQGDPREP